MSRLTWDIFSYETGVDHGVLYTEPSNGVPWNGLVNVSKNASGGEVESYYIDGLKYLNRSTREECKLLIESFTYPDEFDIYDELADDAFSSFHRKKSFGFTYRTLLNDDHYLIHLVYNAQVENVPHNSMTFNDGSELSNFIWPIVTKATHVQGYLPSAHLIIDSRDALEEDLEWISDILYGTPTVEPRFPSISEVKDRFRRGSGNLFDAGYLHNQYNYFVDSGYIDQNQTDFADGGGP